MTHRTLTALAVLCSVAAAVPSGPAAAQSDPMAMVREATANQLGVMEYCQDQGYADADAVSAQRAGLTHLPPAPAGSPSTDAAEALGRKGTLSMNGQDTTLASLASMHNTTVGGMCGQLASAAKQSAAAMNSMPAMPATPGGLTAVPGLSGMPGGMPSIPGMPGAPPAAPQ